MARLVGGLAAVVLLGAISFIAIVMLTHRVDVSRDIGQRARDPVLIEKGRYLAVAADCVSCHTADGGFDFAGRRPLDTPFGTIYSDNITPDPETGIGGWTAGRFEAALVEGRDDQRQLYPAMPYTSFHLIARDDIDALYAYFMSLKPIATPAKANALSFPFDIRALMLGWNLLFLDRGAYQLDAAKTETWNRGAYLATALGHCGECHTPRGIFGEMEASETLAGAKIGSLMAPDIRSATLKAAGWARDDLVTFFETGAGPKGSAFGDMFLAVKNSLRRLTLDDRTALAVYLLDERGDEPSKGDAAVAAKKEVGDDTAGEALYLTYCSLCHGADGKGVPNVFPPLAGNATIGEPDGVNLVTATAHGIEPQRLSLINGFGPMPAFADRLDPDQMTALINYVRSAFAPSGTAPPPLITAEIGQILATH